MTLSEDVERDDGKPPGTGYPTVGAPDAEGTDLELPDGKVPMGRGLGDRPLGKRGSDINDWNNEPGEKETLGRSEPCSNSGENNTKTASNTDAKVEDSGSASVNCLQL
ncbi:Uu.00g134060.m01.CDS01 [Anthostomella pinea]|uniref:Uu.00g134060.m01.CDS01 n=1 Tax=Anthostomella pinea TaxID=933095 RepID=A0AAI8VQ21_9PEZI|nr:Uu.00g134060.m01.CDS01 [Anthostomella pinea]